MLGSLVIVFREVLEAAILIGILAAATRAIPGRNRWLAGGVVAGLLGAGLVAVFMDVIGQMASGIGQELFNAGVLGIAVIMLAWHNIWMSSHGAALAADARSVGQSIRDGQRECSILLIVVGLAVLREGAETVLFLYGIAAAEGGKAGAMWLGSLSGLALGGGCGIHPLCRFASYSYALVLWGNRLVGVVACCRHGLSGSAIPDSGGCSAQSGSPLVGYL